MSEYEPAPLPDYLLDLMPGAREARDRLVEIDALMPPLYAERQRLIEEGRAVIDWSGPQSNPSSRMIPRRGVTTAAFDAHMAARADNESRLNAVLRRVPPITRAYYAAVHGAIDNDASRRKIAEAVRSRLSSLESTLKDAGAFLEETIAGYMFMRQRDQIYHSSRTPTGASLLTVLDFFDRGRLDEVADGVATVATDAAAVADFQARAAAVVAGERAYELATGDTWVSHVGSSR